MSNQTVKVYQTSIVPKGEALEPVRPSKNVASSMTIEVFHIACFLGVFAFIFAGIWKKAVAMDRAAKAEATNKVNA
ncbi:hypothetical protein [Bacteriovorax sp. Seq25_V]|uniref:hypothetical protein n=1 Tax=Bacteriovorax sp. Seq25_V TaxID=1201288 RepID=UPI000389EF08|nr:hypothetical protein [Bacteriovorax sp. Seq25_V]EQC44019.1 hypothetical protein M900_1510 [Bacteriovorax sp. Seq25_V]